MDIVFRIANQLQRINGHWNGDRLFQETRKIIGAIMQHITYTEYLPKILGSAMEERVSEYTGYDSGVNPAIASVFTSAAYRFGHGMIQVH